VPILIDSGAAVIVLASAAIVSASAAISLVIAGIEEDLEVLLPRHSQPTFWQTAGICKMKTNVSTLMIESYT
jgi:hypothetical protein